MADFTNHLRRAGLSPDEASLAHRLLDAGIPVIAVGPDDVPRQAWKDLHTAADCDLSLFRRGDALLALGGHGLDAVDEDTKVGGSVDNLPPFKSYGLTRTPTGGTHRIVPSCGLGQVSPLTTDDGHVGDYCGGRADRSGRRGYFLPGSRRSKYPEGGYVEEEPWDVEACLAAEPDPGLVEALERAGGSREQPQVYRYGGPAREPRAGVHPYAGGAVEAELTRLDECSLVGWDGPHWDSTHYAVACNLVEFGNSGWSGLHLDDLRQTFLARAATDEAFGPRQHAAKWASAVNKVAGGDRPCPDNTAAEDFAGALPEEPSPDERLARDVERETRRLRVQQLAREELARERFADQPIPEPVGLTDFLAVPDEPVRYRVDGLWPTGGRVVLSAQFKAGKTTFAANLLRSLADGEPFLDQFLVQPASRVVVVDDELSPNMIRLWLREQGIQNTGAADVLSLRGRLASFNVLDPVTRSRWATSLGSADLLIFDCLRPALDALGLSEDKEAGRFLEALDELVHEAGIGELLVIHHMGHSNERSRGDSRLLDWPDAVWKLVLDNPEDPRSTRHFAAYGRDVDQSEIRLAYDPVTRHLTVDGGSRQESRANQRETDVLNFILENPGCSQSKIEQGVPGDATALRAAARSLVAAGLVRVEREGQARRHYAEAAT